MNIDSAFPSNYLKAADLGENQPVVTIDRMEIEPIGRNKEMKPVVYFRGKEKGLVLNKTNANKIAALTGSKDTDDWIGCQIRIYATETEFAGEPVDCIRVKPVGSKKAEPKPEPVRESYEPAGIVDDSDIPF